MGEVLNLNEIVMLMSVSVVKRSEKDTQKKVTAAITATIIIVNFIAVILSFLINLFTKRTDKFS